MSTVRCIVSGLSLVCLLQVGIAQTTGLQPGSPWPKLHADAYNTGVGSAPSAVGVQRWSYTTGGWLEGGVVIAADGTVYAGSLSGTFYAFDGATGQVRWTFAEQGSAGEGAAIGVDGTVYLVSFDDLYALDGATGAQKWDVYCSGGFQGAPSIASNGGILIGEGEGMCELDGQTGAQLWSFPVRGGLSGPPAVGPDGTIYFGCGDYNVYALDGATGGEKWVHAGNASVQSDPVLGVDGTLYFGCDDGNVYAFDSSNGAEKWSSHGDGWSFGSPSLGTNGDLYIGTMGGSFYALDSSTGAQVWTFKVGQEVACSPAIASDGTVYIAEDNVFYALDPTTGAIRWRFATGDLIACSPAIGADGTVYFGSFDDEVYAIAPLLVSNFFVSPSAVNGGSYPRAVVQLNAAAQTNETVNLSSSSPDMVVPAKISIPAGSRGASFAVKTATVSAPESVTLTASFNSAVSQLDVTLNPYPILRFYCAQSSFIGSGATTGVVQLSGFAAPSGNVVNLTSSSPDVSVPQTVTVPAGTIGVSFPVGIMPASSEEAVTLTAEEAAVSKEFVFHLSPYPISKFYVSSSSLTGGLSARAVIQLAGKAGANGDTVALTPSGPSVQIPSSVTVATGQTGISFPVDAEQVSSPTLVTIAASLGSSGRTLTLTLLPNSLSTFYVSPAALIGGTVTHGVVQLDVPAGSSGAVVSLSSSDPHVVVPSSITIPAFSVGTSFQIRTLSVSNALPVVLTATYAGKPSQATVSLTP